MPGVEVDGGENYMPLARFSLFAQGCEVYVAPTWDVGSSWVSTMRHIAREARCWALGNGTAIEARTSPPTSPSGRGSFPDVDDWFNPGDSVIVAPDGEMVAGPLHEKHGILFAECDPARASVAKRTMDVAGHYGRPDIFRLEVNRDARPPVDFSPRT